METIPYFDAHCDTVSRCAADGRALRQNRGHLDLARLRRYGPAAQVFALFADGGRFDRDGLWDECVRQHGVFLSELEKNRDIAVLCRTGEEARAAAEEGRVAAFLSVEGGELLDCDPDRLDDAASWGVRFVNLTWNRKNALAGSHLTGGGLTDRGREFVRRAEALGIFIDVSHLSDEGFWQLMETAQRPVVATHSDARAVYPHSRNLTDDMFSAICASGGAAGINFYADFLGGDSLEDVARHIEHFLSLGGGKNLCLGGDLDGCERLGGMRDVTGAAALWKTLAARGLDEALLGDIFYNNLSRLTGTGGAKPSPAAQTAARQPPDRT